MKRRLNVKIQPPLGFYRCKARSSDFVQESQVLFNKLAALLYAVDASQRVGRGVEGEVYQPVDGGGSYVQAGVGGGVVDVYLVVLIDHCAVSEDDIRHIADALDSVRTHEHSRRLGYQLCGVVEGCGENIEDVSQSSRSVSDAVSYMYPAALGLDGHGSRAVLDLGDGVVAAGGDDFFFGADNRVRDVLNKSDADSAA